MLTLRTWLLPSGPTTPEIAAAWDDPDPLPWSIEVLIMRLFGAAWLLLVLLEASLTAPQPGLHGRNAAVLVALLALCASVFAAKPWRAIPPWRRVAALVAVTGAAAALAVAKPDDGSWPNGPLLVGLVSALWLERIAAVAMLAFGVIAVAAVAVVDHQAGALLSIVFNALPWFLVVRLMCELAAQHHALRASRAAEAKAAAEAERARLAREMHDILAHSLSALALQLESTRLLAASHDAGDEVTRAIDQAHRLAANGLQEARHAIATARGDELPGPESIDALATTFQRQSGLPVGLAVQGKPRVLAPDARLAVYRTAQEALTNIRRHTSADHVEITLSYMPQSTVLVVEDHALRETPPPRPVGIAGSGYGLTGMRERAELLGGELIAEPTDTGFRVELRLPT